MGEHDGILAALERIEQNQAKALQMQAEQIAMARAQMERTEAKVAESIKLQQVAVARQASAMKILMPVIAVLVLLALYLVFTRLT